MAPIRNYDFDESHGTVVVAQPASAPAGLFSVPRTVTALIIGAAHRASDLHESTHTGIVPCTSLFKQARVNSDAVMQY